MGLSGPLISGCGRLAQSVATICGWTVLVWDISLGAAYDLRAASKRRLIGEWVRCGWVLGFHLGTPSDSFARARDIRPGPPPLRSDEMPLGLPDLRPGDQLKVITGNGWMRFSAWLLNLALRFCVFATLENPERSRLWLCPPITALMRKQSIYKTVTHYCFWGTVYRKATTFLSANFVLTRLENSLCKGPKRGICAFSLQRHVQLCGQTSDGQWRTHAAQAYPKRLCNAIAKSLYSAQVARIASNVDRLLT